MNCPRCGKEMEKGGIIAGGVTAMWHPQGEFEKKVWKRVIYVDGKSIGKSSILLNQTRIPDAYYCSRCKIVTGIFEVSDMRT